jgi:hypothetical protein
MRSSWDALKATPGVRRVVVLHIAIRLAACSIRLAQTAKSVQANYGVEIDTATLT